jgi:hypothetical protein
MIAHHIGVPGFRLEVVHDRVDRLEQAEAQEVAAGVVILADDPDDP